MKRRELVVGWYVLILLSILCPTMITIFLLQFHPVLLFFNQVLGLPPIICFFLAIQPLFDQAYNYSGIYACGIAEYPQGCLNEYDDKECTRGSNAMELIIAHFTCICFANVIIVASVSVLIHHVISNERRMNTNMTVDNSSNDLSSKATWQGIFYVSVFMFCWGPWYLWQVRNVISQAVLVIAISLSQVFKNHILAVDAHHI